MLTGAGQEAFFDLSASSFRRKRRTLKRSIMCSMRRAIHLPADVFHSSRSRRRRSLCAITPHRRRKRAPPKPILLEDEEECLRSPAERLCRGAGRIKMTSRGRIVLPRTSCVAGSGCPPRSDTSASCSWCFPACGGWICARTKATAQIRGVSGVCEERPVLLPFVLLYSVAKCGFLAA